DKPHWLAAAALALALLVLVVLDFVRPKSQPDDDNPAPPPPITPSNWKDVIAGARPSLAVGFTEHSPLAGALPGRWGLTTLDYKDTNNDQEYKRLTFDKNGATNNTIIKVNNYELVFGQKHTLTQVFPQKEVIKDRYWTKTVRYNEHFVEVTQHV